MAPTSRLPQAERRTPTSPLLINHCGKYGQRPKAGGRRTPSCLSGPGRRAPPPGKAEVTSHRPPPLPHKAKPPPHAHLAPSASLGTPLAVLRARGQRLGAEIELFFFRRRRCCNRASRAPPLPPPRPRTRPNGHLTPTWRRVSAWEYPWPCLGPGGKGGGSSPAPSPVMCVRVGLSIFRYIFRPRVPSHFTCSLSFIVRLFVHSRP